LIGLAGEGIQVGLRTDNLDNAAVVWGQLWQKQPSVSFTFGGAKVGPSLSELYDVPKLTISGEMEQKSKKSYSMRFSYNLDCEQPNIVINDGKVFRNLYMH
jgi:hypothetical protein